MKQGLTLTELAGELERQAAIKRDFVADTRMASVVADDGDVGLELDVSPEPGWSRDVERFEISDHAHRQIGSRLKIPAPYYDRMRAEAPELLAGNINHWFSEEPEQRMIRTMGGKARAFLSRKFRPIDNDEVATALLPVLQDVGQDAGLEIASTQITDRKMYIKALFPRIQADVTVGDTVQAGVVISNSEIGAGALKVETLIYRLVCLNGMISADRSLKKSHVGRILGDGDMSATEVYRDETIRVDNRAFVMKLQDVVRAAASAARFEDLVDQMRETTERAIEGDLVRAVEVAAKQFALTDGEGAGMLRHLAEGGDLSQWGMLNAVTRLSQDVDDYDRATELETIGGQILDLGPSDWRPIAQAA